MTQPLLWPVTPLQAGLVALAQLREPGEVDPYVGQSLLRIDGPADPAALERAVETLTEAHPNLRAGFGMDLDVDPVQFVADDVPVDLRVHPLAPGEDPRALAAAELAEPFDLGDPPLVRWLLLHDERPDEPSWLVLTAHHAVLDGWSMPLLVAALAEHHRAVLAGAPAPAAAADYSRFLAWVGAQPAAAADAHWAGRFGGLELTGTAPWLGRDLADATGESAPRRTSLRVDGDTVARLREQAAAVGTTPAAVARAAWGLTLDHLAGIAPGRGAAVFATTVSGRPEEVPDADVMIGLFADAVLTEVPATPGAPLADVVRAHHDDWLASLPYQHTGLRGCYRALGREELATSLFSFEAPREDVAHPLGGSSTFTLAATVDRSHYPWPSPWSPVRRASRGSSTSSTTPRGSPPRPPTGPRACSPGCSARSPTTRTGHSPRSTRSTTPSGSGSARSPRRPPTSRAARRRPCSRTPTPRPSPPTRAASRSSSGPGA
ncbi:condensation domain-containing protein [Nocardioides humi]|uniref:condensation domain-containing protein n=1 Tax=Nocardioides humi TaxID=449461 RepID=UPI00112DE3A8|nr:condensation domain-containing protein [Nocardioides humi]